MEDAFEHIEELISKYLSGEATTAETARLNAWRKKSSENENHFQESKKLFEALARAESTHSFDVDAAWKKMEGRIGKSESKIIPLLGRLSFAKVAASILLLITLGFVTKWLFFSNNGAETRIAASNTTTEQKLPDGSKVFLNKNSEMTYAVSKNKREVRLKGEAFFEVVHNEEQPFVITINDVMVKDIGTAFNVKALPESNTIEVLVESGEVKFYSSINAGLNLVKGEKAVYNKGTGEFTKSAVPITDNSMSYKSKIFHFNGSSLKEVLLAVNEVYGCDLRLENEHLAKCKITVEFNHESLEDIISIIEETLDLVAERKGGTVILKGAVCPE